MPSDKMASSSSSLYSSNSAFRVLSETGCSLPEMKAMNEHWDGKKFEKGQTMHEILEVNDRKVFI